MERNILIIVIFLSASGCADRAESPRPKQNDVIPEDVSYSIIKTEIQPPFNVYPRLHVRINRRVSEDILRSIALKLKAENSGKSKMLIIFFNVPGMETFWARADFRPDLKVDIMGLTEDQNKMLGSLPNDETREVIGSWLSEQRGVCYRMIFYRRDGKIYGEQTHSDGSGRTFELIEKEARDGRRFEEKNPINPQVAKEADEHWLVDQSGKLQNRDKDGTYSTVNKFP